MGITLFQVDQIIRVYDRQLRTNPTQRGRNVGGSGHSPDSGSVKDTVTISAEGKKKQVLEKVAAGIIERITQR